MNEALYEDSTYEKIKTTLFQMGYFKALGLDGFPTLFTNPIGIISKIRFMLWFGGSLLVVPFLKVFVVQLLCLFRRSLTLNNQRSFE
jgi:hypothetical protein